MDWKCKSSDSEGYKESKITHSEFLFNRIQHHCDISTLQSSSSPTNTAMSTATVQTVKTQFVTAKDGSKLAYRLLGPSTGVPLLFLQHFRGTIDHWDPRLIHLFTAKRPVILFDNAGIGHSNGNVDNNIPAMAAHVIEFLSLINVKHVDILGFSLGGVIAPLVELNGPKGLVRKLILAGTSPTAGKDVTPSMNDEFVMQNAGVSVLTVQNFLNLFFKPSETSQVAGKAWWNRIHERTKETSGEDRVGYVSEGMTDGGAGITALVESFTKAGDIANAKEGSYDRLGDIKAPTLVANGYEDIMVPTINSKEDLLLVFMPLDLKYVYSSVLHLPSTLPRTALLFRFADLPIF
jgi:pimeloyl-ACP methyl ester carboxylesterase